LLTQELARGSQLASRHDLATRTSLQRVLIVHGKPAPTWAEFYSQWHA
jgi:hypothetical protein